MKQTIFKLLAVIGFVFLGSTLLYAQKEPQHMSETKIRQLDRKLTLHEAKQREFNSKSEFERHRSYYRGKYPGQHTLGRYSRRSYYTDIYYYRIPPYYGRVFARGHRHPKRGWNLAYRYDRAAFYDRNGFYYGYFNRYGYFFEGVFYRYDRFYTYRDRVRGKGLFDRLFYPPANYRYYGFCR
ncbi:hypothetical protein YH65_04615 [Sulfurovum lithotrophicum]|uniref:Uncharacterized protein n=1 Tax=Sulfurovum lithotrophicum TaxID=206403 RepID=A0A7U4RQC4_9BACT|nr:hypothetical protein [Sulfurovum lithotrophicum]AKF24748.1 hypothetical protein YH65_04615 [Sulfurovum lithotrophicum]